MLDALDAYLDALQTGASLVAGGDRDGLLELLERARAARRNLPVGAPVGADLVELRVPVPDRPGVIAEVTTLAGRLGVNIADFEIAHSLEGGARCARAGRRRPTGADAFEDGLHDARLPHQPDGAAVTAAAARRARVRRRAAAARHASACPGDKSISHRALLFAALADGRSTITHLATGDDVAATARALEQLGVKIRDARDGAIVVHGHGRRRAGASRTT